MVRSASSIESSAPIVTVSPSPWPSSPALTDEGSLPCAITFTTMSRSVIMPLRRLSEPQIGIAPTSSSARRLATSETDWSSWAHSAPLVMTSRAVLAMLLVPPLSIRGSDPGVPAPRAKMQGVRRPRLAADLTPLRASRELRLLVLGNFVSGMGTQAALVALPYQVYVQTHSALKTGLLGAAELGPLVVMALLGGALADRADRRRLLLIDQIALVAVSAVLGALAVGGSPPLGVLYVLAGLLAGFGAIQNVARSAIVPNLVEPARLHSALAVNFGLYQLTMVVGPAIGGLLIAAGGVQVAYGVDAVSCSAMVFALIGMRPQLPHGHGGERRPILRSIAEGLRFVRGKQALLGSFAIDLMAMTFGMPRALFPVLSVSVYHAGASGTGLLFAAVSAGATVAALTTRWINHVRRLGLIVIAAVTAWGLAITLAAAVPNLWFAAAMLALAGA